MEMIGNQHLFNKYVCIICNYNTSKKCNYAKHMSTSKHTVNATVNEKVAKVAPKVANFACNKCGIQYVTNSGLWKHKKLCKIDIVTNTDPNITLDIDTESDTDTNTNTNTEANPGLLKKDNLIEYLIKENSEFKNLIMELIKKDFSNNVNNTNNTNNNNTNNTICNNNSFNLNVFLNDKCKGAMNMSEFMDTINIQMSDLENFAYVDYADGVSKILLKNLNNLEEYLRPIHCSDLKRETIYIKENDCWTKETDDKPNLKKAIKQVAFKNIKHISEWIKEHPGCQDPRTKQNVKYNKIVMNSMSGGTIEEQQDNIEKIVKNVVKAVTIDKHCVKS